MTCPLEKKCYFRDPLLPKVSWVFLLFGTSKDKPLINGPPRPSKTRGIDYREFDKGLKAVAARDLWGAFVSICGELFCQFCLLFSKMFFANWVICRNTFG